MTHRCFRLVVTASILVACAPHAARAQLYLGDTVRLSIANVELRRGAFLRADSEAVYLRIAGDAEPSRTPYGDYTRAEVLLGHHPMGAKSVSRGTMIGMGIGAALGLASVVFDPARSVGGSATSSAGVGALLGGAAGLGMGAAASGTDEEVWRSIDIRRLAIGPPAVTAGAAPRETPPRDVAASPLLTSRPTRAPGVVSVGDTVRLYAGKTLLVHGILAATGADALQVVPDGMSDPTPFSRERITLAQVQRGQRRRGARALGTGALIGAGVGTVIFIAGASDHSSQSEGLGAAVGLVFGLMAAVTGTLVGGVVAVTFEDRWIRFDTVTLSMLPDEG